MHCFHFPPIRKLADIDEDSCLSSAEFPLAMFLVQQTLRGVPIPLYLPEQLHKVYVQVVNPQLPVATDAHLSKCKKAFEAFRQNIGKAVLGGQWCVPLCMLYYCVYTLFLW